MLRTPDAEIWEYAKLHGFVITSTDADFLAFAANGPPPKVIWLQRWDHPTRDAEALLRREAVRIKRFDEDVDLAY